MCGLVADLKILKCKVDISASLLLFMFWGLIPQAGSVWSTGEGRSWVPSASGSPWSASPRPEAQGLQSFLLVAGQGRQVLHCFLPEHGPRGSSGGSSRATGPYVGPGSPGCGRHCLSHHVISRLPHSPIRVLPRPRDGFLSHLWLCSYLLVTFFLRLFFF